MTTTSLTSTLAAFTAAPATVSAAGGLVTLYTWRQPLVYQYQKRCEPPVAGNNKYGRRLVSRAEVIVGNVITALAMILAALFLAMRL